MTTRTDPLPPVQQRYSFLMHRINAQLMRICNPMMRELQVDLVVSRMLVVLMEEGELPAGDIVRIMALPQSTVSHQLKRLAKQGYVRRTPGRDDSRTIVAALTPEGRRVAEACNALSAKVTDVMVAALDGLDGPMLRLALQRMDAALGTLRTADA